MLEKRFEPFIIVIIIVAKGLCSSVNIAYALMKE